MTKHGEQRAISNFVHTPSILGAHWDPQLANQPEVSAADVRSCLNTLYEGRWLIGAIATVITVIAILYALVAHPVYEANLMIHVEEEIPNASKNTPNQVSPVFEVRKSASAEMDLLRSRMVVARAVDNLQSFIDVRPKFFPIAALRFAQQHDGSLSTPGLFGYGGYVWGGERANVSLLNVPATWLNREFLLTVQGQQHYRLSDGDHIILADGVVDHRYHVQMPDGPFDIKVDSLQANAGAEFYLKRRSRLATIEAVQKAMVMTEHGKQSGVIEVKLQGENAQTISSLLGEIGREYVRQNLDRQSEAADKSLAFLDQQLPIVKRQLADSEVRYNQFRNVHGTVDLREEGRIGLEQAVAARNRRIELLQKKTELMARFTEDHPIVEALNRQRKDVESEIDELAAKLKTLPLLQQEEQRLTREIKVNTELYAALSSNAQQLRLASVGRVSNVRMIDVPIAPEEPVQPKRWLIVVLGFSSGLFIGIFAAFARKALNGGIDDPLKIERLLRARVVYATIPHSATQEKLMRQHREDSRSAPLLAHMAPEDPAIESLRSFRVALQFSMPHFKNNIVMLTGPTRCIGKSFIAANFAAIMAASGKRVLLIDSDLRSGHLHRYFGVRREPGLSNLISGSTQAEQTIHHNVADNLDFIATGTLPPNRSEYLLHLNFGNLLETVSHRYDVVLIDPPPILAVADALIIGSYAGAVFIVTRCGVTTEDEINESIKRLNHAGIAPQGVLFNDLSARLHLTASHSRYGEPDRLSLAT